MSQVLTRNDKLPQMSHGLSYDRFWSLEHFAYFVEWWSLAFKFKAA